MKSTTHLAAWTLGTLAASLAASGCGDAPPGSTGETLSPEPAGAPTALADGRLSCLGSNKPPPLTGAQVVLPGWTRFYADPTAATLGAPAAKVEAFDESGVSLGSSFASQSDGRVAVTVPVSDSGFTGHLVATLKDLVDYHFYSSRPYTSPEIAGWAWMLSSQQLANLATSAGTTITPGTAVAAIGVHDCDGFGVANAVFVVNGKTSGGIYLEEFKPAPARTFSSTSGRAAWLNLPPGPITIKAFGRTQAGGPLVLLSLAEVQLKADTIVGVDLAPRVGAAK